jgi:hypothetical protein
MRDFDLALKRAAERNAERDAIDRAAGFKPPADSRPAEHLGIAIGTLHAAIESKNWSAAFECLAMLRELRERL